MVAFQLHIQEKIYVTINCKYLYEYIGRFEGKWEKSGRLFLKDIFTFFISIIAEIDTRPMICIITSAE